MTGRIGKYKIPSRFTRPTLTCMVGIAVGLIGSPAFSQSDGSVSVDLSVLNDGGASPPSSLPAYVAGRKLLVPPLSLPVSRLYIAPSSAPKLVQPANVAPKFTKPALPKPKLVSKPKPKKIMTPAPTPTLALKSTERVAPLSMTAATPVAPPAPIKAMEPVAIATAPPAPMEANAPPPPPKMADAPKPTKEPEAVSVAKLPVKVDPGQAVRIEFGGTATKIPDDAKTRLLVLAEGVRDKADVRLQLMAYAGGEDLSASKARRMSLSRALSVRSFLIENGVRSTRIDVRALGNKTSEKPANRVDVNIANR